MLAAVWHGQDDVRLEDVPEPRGPGPDELLVEVRWSGICGTDLHEYRSGPIFIPPTLDRVVLGHEFTATVVQVGRDVRDRAVGDRIVVIPHRLCRSCAFCRRGLYQHCRNLELVGLTRDGAFARYTIVRADQAVLLPPEVPDDVGALVEPLAVTFHAMRFPEVRIGQTCAIVGAGPIGLCGVLTTRAAGVGRVIVVEQLAARRALAAELGADVVIDPGAVDPLAAIAELTRGEGVDYALECVGTPETVVLAMRAVRRRGLAIVLGIAETIGTVDLDEVRATEKQVRGCIGYFDGEFPAVVELLRSGRLDPRPIITSRIGLSDLVAQGFDRLIGDRGSAIKVLVSPDEQAVGAT